MVIWTFWGQNTNKMDPREYLVVFSLFCLAANSTDIMFVVSLILLLTQMLNWLPANLFYNFWLAGSLQIKLCWKSLLNLWNNSCWNGKIQIGVFPSSMRCNGQLGSSAPEQLSFVCSCSIFVLQGQIGKLRFFVPSWYKARDSLASLFSTICFLKVSVFSVPGEEMCWTDGEKIRIAWVFTDSRSPGQTSLSDRSECVTSTVSKTRSTLSTAVFQ